jgi:hypothetical protein
MGSLGVETPGVQEFLKRLQAALMGLAAVSLVESGIMTIEEARAILGLAPLSDERRRQLEKAADEFIASGRLPGYVLSEFFLSGHKSDE